MTNIISHTSLRAFAVVVALSFSAVLYGADGKDANPAKADKPAASAPIAPAKADKPAVAPSSVGVREHLTREQTNEDAQKARDTARQLDREGKYEQAIDKFLQAKKIWEDLNANDPNGTYGRDVEEMKKAVAETYFRWSTALYNEAMKDANEKHFDVAIEKCLKAAEMYPPVKEDMLSAIERFKKQKVALEFKNETEQANSDADAVFEESQSSAEVKLQQAKMLYKIGRYDESRKKFESILAKDPYNSTAIEYMRRIYLKMIYAGEKRKDMFAAEALNDVAWKPIAPILVTGQDENEEVAVQSQEKVNPSQKMMEKLTRIKFKSLSFEEMRLSDVIEELRERSQQQVSEGGDGVNFVLRLHGNAASTSEDGEGEEDVGGEDDSAETGSEEGDNEPKIDFSYGRSEDEGDDSEGGDAEKAQDEVTLYQVIDEICRNNGLVFRVEPYAVVIAGKNVALDDCVTEFYTIDKDALEGDGVCNGDITPESLKAYFTRLKVPFEGNAKISYDEKINKLIVTNTPENQVKVASLVKDLNVSNPQVQIQVKFVEVSLNDLEELGFEYTFSRVANERVSEDSLIEVKPGEGGRTNVTPVYDDSGDLINYRLDVGTETMLIQKDRTTVSNGNSTDAVIYNPLTTVGSYTKLKEGQKVLVPVTVDENDNFVFYTYAGDPNATHTFEPNDQLVRNAYDTPEAFGLESNAGREDRVFSWTRSDENGYSFNATIHALDQADSTDVLSSPRVTTMPGEEAVIKMITEKYYPDSWGDAEMDDVNGRSVFIPSVPEFGDPVEEGVALTVTPTIADDEKYTLEMDMEPTILEFGGWTDYSYTVVLGDENTPKQNTLKMPIIQARQVRTKITCYDKSTVTLGGIIKDKVNNVDDQYPILGDIPLIGRLFQSKGKNSEKTNLLIFMTGTMVNYDGTLYRQDEASRGIPRM